MKFNKRKFKDGNESQEEYQPKKITQPKKSANQNSAKKQKIAKNEKVTLQCKIKKGLSCSTISKYVEQNPESLEFADEEGKKALDVVISMVLQKSKSNSDSSKEIKVFDTLLECGAKLNPSNLCSLAELESHEQEVITDIICKTDANVFEDFSMDKLLLELFREADKRPQASAEKNLIVNLLEKKNMQINNDALPKHHYLREPVVEELLKQRQSQKLLVYTFYSGKKLDKELVEERKKRSIIDEKCSKLPGSELLEEYQTEHTATDRNTHLSQGEISTPEMTDSPEIFIITESSIDDAKAPKNLTTQNKKEKGKSL